MGLNGAFVFCFIGRSFRFLVLCGRCQLLHPLSPFFFIFLYIFYLFLILFASHSYYVPYLKSSSCLLLHTLSLSFSSIFHLPPLSARCWLFVRLCRCRDGARDRRACDGAACSRGRSLGSSCGAVLKLGDRTSPLSPSRPHPCH